MSSHRFGYRSPSTIGLLPLPFALAANMQRAANLPEAPSIRAALELLSDKESTEQQRELTEVKAELPHGQFLPWIEAEFEKAKDL